jgi:hypothetical protein
MLNILLVMPSKPTLALSVADVIYWISLGSCSPPLLLVNALRLLPWLFRWRIPKQDKKLFGNLTPTVFRTACFTSWIFTISYDNLALPHPQEQLDSSKVVEKSSKSFLKSE